MKASNAKPVVALAAAATVDSITLTGKLAPSLLPAAVAMAFAMSGRATHFLRHVMDQGKPGLQAIADRFNALRAAKETKKAASEYTLFHRQWTARRDGKGLDSAGKLTAPMAYGIVSQNKRYVVVESSSIVARVAPKALVSAGEAQAIVQQLRETLALKPDADASAIKTALSKLSASLAAQSAMPSVRTTKRAPLRRAA